MSSRVCIDIIALLAQWSVVCPEVGSDNRTCLVQRYSRPIRLFTPQWTFIVCWGFEPMHEISVEFATFRHTIHGDIPCIGSNPQQTDRKSTRLNSSHQIISYAVFCFKKK